MRELIRKFWNKIKWGLFLIIWSAGLLGWAYFYQEFKVIKCEANQAYNESIKLKIERTKINAVDDAQEAETKVEASKEVSLGGTAEPKNSARPSDIEELIKQTFGDEYQTARAVAFAESRLNEKATNTNTNGTTDCGVFQINSIHRLEDCTDPVKNIEYAKQLFDRSGWYPWVAWKTGRYLAFL